MRAAGWAGLGAAGWAIAGAWGGALAALLAGLAHATHRSMSGPRDHGPSTVAPDAAATRLPSVVVPVWQRNVEAARTHAHDSMQQLLDSFAGVIGHLDGATQETGIPSGALAPDMDSLLAEHAPEMEKLLATTRLAVQLKDRMLAGVESVAAALEPMRRLAQDVQNISRATHLLALNASVEATRADGGSGGFAMVAQEVRRLAGEARQASQRLGEHVETLQQRLHDLRHEVRLHDTEDDEITRQGEENARAVLRALLGSTGQYQRATLALQQSSRAVQDDLERILVSLQSQDRLSQMLTAVTDDMARLRDWLDGRDDPLASQPGRWLERLEQSYTMEEQRTTHHGGAQIDRTSAVEFF